MDIISTTLDIAPETHALWWQKGVVYQVYPRSFQDSNADGIGDLPGITARLDYLVGLGVDAIWISPIFQSPMKDFGYDISDYRAVDPIFGSLADLDELLEAAHARGLRVLLDFVPNHTSDQHPWFLESRASRDSRRRDWYVWRDPAPDGGPPNNWLSHFNGPAWTFDPATGQYFLAQFLNSQPSLNWANPEVRAAMHDNLRFWLERGVDGFRVDVIWMIGRDPQFRDDPPNPDWVPGMQNHRRLLRINSEGAGEVHRYIREMRGVLDEYSTPGRERVMVGEIYRPVEELVTYYGRGEACHLPFNFHLIHSQWNASVIRQLADHYDRLCNQEQGWPNWVLGNHDRNRFKSRLGAAQYRVAQTLLLTLRGTPTMYYGDEIGMTDVMVPVERRQDPAGFREPDVPEANRDPERTPMQWDATPHAGFSTAEPWLPVADDYRERNVAAQSVDPNSDLNYASTLLALRRRHPALHSGEYRSVTASDDVFAFLREQAADRVLVVLNFSAVERTLDLSGVGTGRLLLSSRQRDTHVDLASLTLHANEALIVQLGPA